MAEVVYLRNYQTAGNDGVPARTEDNKVHYRTSARAEFEPALSTSNKEVDIGILYNADSPSGAMVARVRELLSQATSRLEVARRDLADGDALSSDEQVSLIQADFPELFCCRKLSPGFAAIVLALHYSLLNRRSRTVSVPQLTTIIAVLQSLRDRLFLSFEESLDFIDQLEISGLQVNPDEAEALGELLAAV